MTDIWSPIATRIVRTSRRDLILRMRAVAAVIVHTTGGGIVTKALKAGKDPLQYAADYYARPNAYASGYLVGPFANEEYDAAGDDTIVGTVPDNLVAYHAGVSKARLALYRVGYDIWARHILQGGNLVDTGRVQARYGDWRARWPGADSPLDLLPGFERGVNAITLSADLLAPEPGHAHADLQCRWMASLVGELLERHGLSPSKGTVLRHSDVDPLTRSSPRGGWDPPQNAFARVCDALGIG